MSDLPVIIYTDGSCRGNPGPGGWAAILLYGDKTRELSGGEPQTTNNRMEMMAVIQALQALTRPCIVRLHTDSQLIVNTMTKGWKRKANQDLWVELDQAAKPHDVAWVWVKGHASDTLNNRVDHLAVEEAKSIQRRHC